MDCARAGDVGCQLLGFRFRGLLFSALYVVSLTVLVHDISIASKSVSCGEFSPMVMRDNLSVGVGGS